MTESKQKAVELVEKFTTLEDAIICVDEILKTYDTKNLIYYQEFKFWREVLTHLGVTYYQPITKPQPPIY